MSLTKASYSMIAGAAINVLDYGAKGDGITPDQTAIQAAIDAAPAHSTVVFPAGVYLIVNTITIPASKFINIIGDNATLLAGANNISLLRYEENIVRNGCKILQGLVFEGNAYTSVIGFEQQGANLKFTIQNCFFRYLDIGCSLGGSMECSVIDCGTWRNRIGIQLISGATTGGGNGNNFIGNTVQEDEIGYLFYNFGTYPFGNNNIYGGVIQGSGYCGVAVFGGNASIIGAHFEAIGLAVSSTTTIYGSTLGKSCSYCENGWISISDIDTGQAQPYPQLNLSNARGVLRNITGFGQANVNLVAGDNASTVEFIGGYNSVGTTDVYVTQWPSSIGQSITKVTFKGTPTIVRNDFVPNIYMAGNPQTPLLDNATGATYNGVITDIEQGFVSSVSFLASAGATNSNRITIPAMPAAFSAGDYCITSFLVKSSAPSTFVFAFDLSLCTFFGEIGTSWTRVVIAFKSYTSASSPDLYVFPTDSVGATLRFSKINSFTASAYSAFDSVAALILNGHWNSNKQSQLNNNAAPTTGTWRRGDIVYNTTPSSGGYIGWICTAAGTPGTWNTFGLIS